MKNLLLLFLFLTLPFSSYSMTPNVSQITTKSGYNLWLIEDNYLPIISIKIVFEKSGSAYDEKGKEGLAYFISSMLDEGAGNLTALEYKKQLEAIATSINFGVSEDNFYVTVKTLKSNVEKTLELLNLALTKPNLKQSSISRVKKQILVKINKKKEDPYNIASEVMTNAIFKDHAYSKKSIGTVESISSITKKDLDNFIRKNFTRENIVISAVGDFGINQMGRFFDSYIEIPNSKANPAQITDVIPAENKDVIRKEFDVPQSVILFAANSVKRNSKDFYPLYILNHIFGGGGFESRLMNEVREKNGLVYTIYSYIDPMDKVSLLSGYAGTDNNTVDKAISIIKEEIRKIAEDGVTEQELIDAKDYLINSFPLKLTKNENIASFLSVMQTEELGADFLNKRNQIIADISLEKVNSLAKKYFKIDQFTFVVVGGEVSLQTDIK